MIGGIIAGYQEDQEATCGRQRKDRHKMADAVFRRIRGELYCIFDSDLDAAVMLGTRLPLEIFLPALRRQTMTTNRKADMQSKIKHWLKTATTRDRVSLTTHRSYLAFLKML